MSLPTSQRVAMPRGLRIDSSTGKALGLSLIVLPKINRFVDMIKREGAGGPPFLAGFSWRLIFGRPTQTLRTIDYFK
jgi:hypothetical protein